jgi:hypothetical protein
MNHADDGDALFFDPIRDDVRRPTDHELACVLDATWPTDRWLY